MVNGFSTRAAPGRLHHNAKVNPRIIYNMVQSPCRPAPSPGIGPGGRLASLRGFRPCYKATRAGDGLTRHGGGIDAGFPGTFWAPRSRTRTRPGTCPWGMAAITPFSKVGYAKCPVGAARPPRAATARPFLATLLGTGLEIVTIPRSPRLRRWTTNRHLQGATPNETAIRPGEIPSGRFLAVKHRSSMRAQWYHAAL